MENFVFLEITRWIVHLLILACILIAILRFRTLQFEQKIVFYLLSITLPVELVSVWLWKVHINNNFIFHFYTVAEFLLLAIIYRKHLNTLIKSVHVLAVMIAFVLFAVINTVFFQSLKQFNSHTIFVECILLIVLAILYFYKELRDLENRHLERVPMFWINASVITYFSGSLVLFYVANDLISESMKTKGVIWGTHALFNIVHYVLYAIALLIRNQEKTSALKS
ncbi:hypothetical protein QNI19_35065 [Cytophagaceae bacterium DM2B3-1]|uniref:Uncharacterized protein n=1 Tax=Xanthocytophaga flava TaxID=3048013 RepID=A0AAE3UBE5_9BACT|nr:hypothetical protein [Xanthocytophaga flavus]MDJ1485702.1 hypothetical protein [Xanthocytophaga flavus]MDJ1498217.1 hypothetical protein [Xanthocytophaga flavus]